MSGTLNQNDKLENSRKGDVEVLNQLFIMDGKKRELVESLHAGDIGATLKLKVTETNDTLHPIEHKITIKPISYPEARIQKATSAQDKKDDEKLNEVLRKIESQDPTVNFNYSKELKQQILSCQGELHLAIIDWTLKNNFGITAHFEQPRVAYRETIQRSATASYKHKKQSGGAGQFGEVHLKIEPWFEGMPEPEGFNIRGKEVIDLVWGGKLVFYNCIVGGVIDARYLPSILKGILEVMETGPLTGSYARDIRVMVFDGKMHPVDSNDISFKIAGAHAFKAAFLNANPKLMEPINEVIVKVPEELMGNVMTDLQSRRSIILGLESLGKYQQITTRTPLAELYKFSTTLRSITQGRASFNTKFVNFEPVPINIQNELIKNNED